ncbi:phasin family protein [Microvirga sp. 0TCS3.31]
MNQQFEAVQKFGKNSFEATVKALDVASTGTKAIVIETADYAKKSLEQNAATFEKLAGVKSLDQAIQIQSDYFKGAYEGFVAHSTKTRELYTKLAQDSFAPFGFIRSAAEAAVARTKSAAPTKSAARAK